MLSHHDLYLYTFTLIVAALIPGPGMMTILLNTLSVHKSYGCYTLLGLITGDLIYLTLSVLSMSFMHIMMNAQLSNCLVMLGSAYLLYLAFKMWQSSAGFFNSDSAQAKALTTNSYAPTRSNLAAFKQATIITLSNPKTMTFYLAILPTLLARHQHIQFQKLTAIYLITLSVLLGVGIGYIFLATYIQKYLNKEIYYSIMIKTLSVMLAGLALGLAYNQLIN